MLQHHAGHEAEPVEREIAGRARELDTRDMASHRHLCLTHLER